MDFVRNIVLAGAGGMVVLMVCGLLFGPLWSGFSGIAPDDPTATMSWKNLVGFVPIFAALIVIVGVVRVAMPPAQEAPRGY